MDEILNSDELQFPLYDGNVVHAVKKDSPGYVGFGEAYFSWRKFGAVKAWKKHTKMTLNLIVPVGQVKFVFIGDGSEDYFEYTLAACKPQRITVPPGIWFGFEGLSKKQSLILNIADIKHDPSEVIRRSVDHFSYIWTEP